MSLDKDRVMAQEARERVEKVLCDYCDGTGRRSTSCSATPEERAELKVAGDFASAQLAADKAARRWYRLPEDEQAPGVER